MDPFYDNYKPPSWWLIVILTNDDNANASSLVIILTARYLLMSLHFHIRQIAY